MPRIIVIASVLALATACAKEAPESSQNNTGSPAASAETPVRLAGQAAVQDDESQKDVVKVAVASKDHTTLVAALQAADLVNSLANAGPFTVFAPTNAAFDKLPKGTVDDLLKPENKEKLRTVLQHHVTVPALDADALTDGMTLGMVDGGKITIARRGDDAYVGDAKILGSVRASNGVVYVVDGVLLPK
ncbi:MAG: fasciclin domain-containing protein [Gemmatimonadaceae bacterium]|nr:fasciclin domain-containing protein [Gemmatimonadaceae bacterium]